MKSAQECHGQAYRDEQERTVVRRIQSLGPLLSGEGPLIPARFRIPAGLWRAALGGVGR
jgi:hypothetical protein